MSLLQIPRCIQNKSRYNVIKKEWPLGGAIDQEASRPSGRGRREEMTPSKERGERGGSSCGCASRGRRAFARANMRAKGVHISRYARRRNYRAAIATIGESPQTTCDGLEAGARALLILIPFFCFFAVPRAPYRRKPPSQGLVL